MILLGTASAIDLVAERGAQIGPSMELLSILDKKAFSSHFVIYTCKVTQPGIFSRCSQPVYFSRLQPVNLAVLSKRLSGLNLEKCTG